MIRRVCLLWALMGWCGAAVLLDRVQPSPGGRLSQLAALARPQDSGSTIEGAYPSRWSATTGLLWKTPLSGVGCSTPIVWERRIYLTAPVDGQDAVQAFDWSGKLLWQTPLGVERRGKHRNGSGCNPRRRPTGRLSMSTSRAAPWLG